MIDDCGVDMIETYCVWSSKYHITLCMMQIDRFSLSPHGYGHALRSQVKLSALDLSASTPIQLHTRSIIRLTGTIKQSAAFSKAQICLLDTTSLGAELR